MEKRGTREGKLKERERKTKTKKQMTKRSTREERRKEETARERRARVEDEGDKTTSIKGQQACVGVKGSLACPQRG